jgi:hypothetical protein
MKKYEVMVTVISGRNMELKTVRKAFTTDAARGKWLDKQEEAGVLHEVLGYRDPEGC